MPRRKHFLVLILAAVSLSRTAVGWEYEGPVGTWGNPDRVRIEGARQVDPLVIKRSLAGSFKYFLASHPSAPLAGLTSSVQQHLLRGYQHAGFGEARVHVYLDFGEQQVVVQIEEGPRRLAGAIRVEGPANIRETLASLLAERRPPDGATPAELSDYGGVIAWADAAGKKVEEEEPLWIPGLPAQFDPKAVEDREKRVGQTLADLGYDQAKFESTVTTEGAEAEWRVCVSELGPPATLKAIETTGNLNNTRDEIMDYLNLRPGALVTRDFRRGIERSLWNSARFISSQVEVERLPDAGGVRLRIDVREYAHAPRLSEPLSREENAMLQHRYWMVHGAGSRLDIVVTATRPDGHVEVILSPVEGISSCLWQSADAGGPPDFALVADDTHLAAFALAAGRLLAIPVGGVQLNATLSLDLTGKDADHPFRMTFGFGFKSLDAGETRRPLTLTTSMPPVYFLAQAHELEESSWSGPILTIRSKHGVMRIHERTGELIEHVAVPAKADGTAFGYSFERDAFARRTQQLRAADVASDFDAARPVSSVGAFLLNTGMLAAVADLVSDGAFSQRAPRTSLAALGKLVDHGVLSIVDTVAVAVTEDDGDEFKIPWEADPQPSYQLKHFYGFLVAQAADHVFPRDSWAWTLWRESALVVAGLGKHTGTELTKMMADPRCGPSSYWILAELVSSIGSNGAPIAARGLGRCNREAFVGEWETALGRDLHPAVAATLTALRSLSDDDVAALTALADGPPRQWIRIAGELREATEPPAEHGTAELLNAIWSTELRELLEQRLRQLATPPRVSTRLGDKELK